MTTIVTSLSSTQLMCASPPAKLGVVSVSVTQNGQQYHEGAGALRYTTYVHPEVRALGVPGFQGADGSELHLTVVHPEDGYV